MVEKAIIFFKSCWVVAQDEANRAVMDPRIKVPCCIAGLERIRGETRIRRNTPATTIVDL